MHYICDFFLSCRIECLFFKMKKNKLIKFECNFNVKNTQIDQSELSLFNHESILMMYLRPCTVITHFQVKHFSPSITIRISISISNENSAANYNWAEKIIDFVFNQLKPLFFRFLLIFLHKSLSIDMDSLISKLMLIMRKHSMNICIAWNSSSQFSFACYR